MKHVRGLPTPIEALRRLFVLSSKPLRSSHPNRQIPARSYSTTEAASPPTEPRVRFIAGGGEPKKPSRQYGPRGGNMALLNRALARYGPKDSKMPLRDEAITAPYVSLAEDDNLGDPQPLATVLASFDRSEFFLQQMTPVEEGREIPVVRIINKAAHRVAEKKRAKASKSKESTGKTLELGWAITAHDLKHRLDKMVAFLNEGRRVEVLIAQRKKARVLGYKEAAGLIKSVKDRAQAVEGTKERQAMTGVVGRSVTLFFEGKKP